MQQQYEKYFGTETVLVVDDERLVLDFICDLLEPYGYQVIIAVDGKDALEKYNHNKNEIDLVIADILMPVKHGISTYQEIKSVNPNVKYIFMSGFTPVDLAILDDRPFINKPIESHVLLMAIRKILDSDSSV